MTGFFDRGRTAAATPLCGGGSPLGDGFFVEPTVLIDTNEQMKVIRGEIFGSVVAAMSFSDMGDLIARSNNTTYRLATGVWTIDVAGAHQTAKAIKAETIWINGYYILTQRCHSVVLNNRDGGVRWGMQHWITILKSKPSACPSKLGEDRVQASRGEGYPNH